MKGMAETKKRAVIAIICLTLVLVTVLSLKWFRGFSFSLESGFYDEPIELKIYGHPFGEVYYTTDGTKPDTDSIKYDGRILLADASTLENRASGRSDSSIGFDEATLARFGVEAPGYKVPDYNIDKANYIRASYFILGHEIQEISGVYFIGYENKSGYNSIAKVSITTDEDNLWDYNDGIYCTGARWDKYYKEVVSDAASTEAADLSWTFWDANYRMAELASERPCKIDVFDEENQLELSQKCGLRIQGSGSRAENQKGFNIFAREQYSGSDIFTSDLTGSGYYQSKYTLTAGGQDQHFKINDYVVNEALSNMEISTMDYRPCMLFLNGEFWGMYYIVEPYNREYVANHYNVKENNVILYKNRLVEEGIPEDEEYYRQMQDFIINNDMTSDDNYAQACDYIDINSFIDYYVVMHYVGRQGDWPDMNEAVWRVRNVSDESPYADGKWRWMLFDLNSENSQLTNSRVDEYQEQLYSAMWLSLIQNDEFKAQYASRLWYLAKVEFEPSKMNGLLASYYDRYKDSLAVSNKRFYGQTYEAELEQRVFDLSYYFLRRRDITPLIVAEFCGAQYNEE